MNNHRTGEITILLFITTDRDVHNLDVDNDDNDVGNNTAYK